MAAVVVGSVIFNVPRFVDSYVAMVDNGTRSVELPTHLGTDPTFEVVYSGVFFYIVIYAVPIGTLVFLTQRLVVSIRKFYSRRSEQVSEKSWKWHSPLFL